MRTNFPKFRTRYGLKHNPAGLIVSTGMKVYDEKSSKDTVEGRAKQTAKEIAEQLKKRFKEQGWI